MNTRGKQNLVVLMRGSNMEEFIREHGLNYCPVGQAPVSFVPDAWKKPILESLPPLPEPAQFKINDWGDVVERYWDIDQMRAYARTAIAAKKGGT